MTSHIPQKKMPCVYYVTPTFFVRTRYVLYATWTEYQTFNENFQVEKFQNHEARHKPRTRYLFSLRRSLQSSRCASSSILPPTISQTGKPYICMRVDYLQVVDQIEVGSRQPLAELSAWSLFFFSFSSRSRLRRFGFGAVQVLCGC